MDIPSCVLCGGTGFTPLLTSAAMQASRFGRCNECSLLQMRPMPSQREVFDYYQTYDIVGEEHSYFRALWGPDSPGGNLHEPRG